MLSLSVAPLVAQQYVVEEAGLDGGGGLVSNGGIVLTSSLATQPVGTVHTDRYVLFSGLPYSFVQGVALTILHDPSDVEGTTSGVPQTVTARISSNRAPLASASLLYRAGSSQDPTNVQMTQEQDEYVATIPGADIGENGLTYYFVAEDQSGRRARAPQQGVYSVPVRLGTASLQKPDSQPGGQTQAAYRLLSIPISADDPSPEGVLGDDIPTLSSASTYDPSKARLFEPIGTSLAEFPNIGDFEVGRSFWLIVRDQGGTIDVDDGMMKALNESVEIDLRRGWNFIGTPFTLPVPVSNLQTENSNSLTLRSYDASGYNPPEAAVTEMKPFEGYALFVETATTLTVRPPLQDKEKGETATKVHESEGTKFLWRLGIRGTSPTGTDGDNVAAVHEDAVDGWDALDWPEPPTVGDGLSIAFEAVKDGPTDVPLSLDVRRPLTRGATWPVRLWTQTAGPVHLSVTGVANLPDALEAWLVDGKTKASWNLRTTAQARIDVLSDNGSERSLQLVVGTSTYVREMLRDLEALPLQYALHPPYPNPSTGPVALKMSLPQDEDVTVDVYNLLGQRVATLKNGEPMSAGVHTVLWRAPRLGSGMYFVRVEAGPYRSTQKFVLIR